MKFLYAVILTGLFCATAWSFDSYIGESLRTDIPAAKAEQKINFSFSSVRSLYACDYVESEAKKVLKSLGAEKIKVHCSGGLPYAKYVYLRTQFVSILSTSPDKSTLNAKLMPVVIQFDDSCDMHESMVGQLLKGFEVSELHKESSCWDARGRVSYSMNVLGQ